MQFEKGAALAIGALAGVLFFALYSFLSLEARSGATVRLNSPDETANYFFSTLYSRDGTLGFQDPALSVSNNYVHPRSMTVVRDTVRPVSFPGFVVIYGALSRLLSSDRLLFLTPFIAVLGAIFFYILLRCFFSLRIAGCAAFLLLLHPAYMYYANRSMMHNVFFIDLLISGLAVAFASTRLWGAAIGGALVGLSLAVRFSEVLWVAGAFLLALPWLLRRRTILRLSFFFLAACVPVLWLLGLNNELYGHPLTFGYQTVDTHESVRAVERIQLLANHFSFSDFSTAGRELSVIVRDLSQYILPFGFVPSVAAARFSEYGVLLFWWLTPLILFGVAVVAIESIRRSRARGRIDPRLIYTLIFFAVSAWLVVFYGSWLFHDNIAKEVTIGNSYVRYWLPAYAMSLPFIAAALCFFIDRARARIHVIMFLCIIAGVVFFSIRSVFWESSDSLFVTAENLSVYREKANLFFALTPPDAVIFSQRSDKIHFPERRAAQNFEDFREVDLLPQIMTRHDVYYYGFWNEADAAYVTKKYFAAYGLALEYVASFDELERLYHVVARP